MLLFLIQDLRLILKSFNRYNCIFAIIKPMRKILFIILLFTTAYSSNSQIIVSDSSSNINCYTDGFIFTQIPNLDVIVYSKWFYSNNSNWIQVDTSHQSIFINNNKFNSDTVYTTVPGEFKLQVVDILDTLLEERFYTIHDKLSIIIQQDIIECNNDLGGLYSIINGGVVFNPDSNIVGDEFYLYQWFKAEDFLGTNSILLLDSLFFIDSISSSFYQLIVSDSIGCTDSTDYIHLINPDVITINNLDISPATCLNASDGKISFSITGGRKIDSLHSYCYYLLSGSDTICYSDTLFTSINFTSIINPLGAPFLDAVSITNLSSDTLQLIVLDKESCILDTTFFLSEPDGYELFYSNNQLVCSSDSVWIRIDSVTGGLPFFSYFWETSLIDSVFGVSGLYSCIINDTVNNCDETIQVNINSLFDVQVDFTVNNIKCYSDSSGSINIDSIYGGVPPYSINWGQSSLQALVASDYELVINDSLGCVFIDTVSIFQPSPIISIPEIHHPVCNSDTNGYIIHDYSGGIPPYVISGFNALDTMINLGAGLYPYFVTDSNSCQLFDTITLNDPLLVAIQVNFDDSIECFNEGSIAEVEVSDYDSSYVILWSNSSDSNITTLFAGEASVIVIDNNGCFVSDTFVIIQPDTFKIEQIIVIDTICDSGVNVCIDVSGGTKPYYFLWNNGQTDSMLVNVIDSFVSVIISDSCGILISDTIFLSPYFLETSIMYDDSIHNAEVEINNTSSVGPFSYVWTNIYGDTISLDYTTQSLCEGTYFNSIIDMSNNCIFLDTIITSFYLPLGIVDISTTTVYPDSNLWGFGPYSYLWDNGDITQHAFICPGNHWVEIEDSYGCKKRSDFIISPLQIILSPSSDLIECDLENIDIDLEVSATGGIESYSYLWWNGSSDNPINLGMSPGNYHVTVIDGNGCEVDTAFTIATMTSDCVPNVFSPNGDGINDSWSLEDTFLYSESEVRIYGRFGKLIFQSVGYYTPWDGTSENGQDLPDGVYFYYLEIGNGFDPIKGTVTIIR